MYTLLVCADLYGEKLNIELTFSAMPTMGELQRKVNEVFNGEGQVKRPQGYPAVDFQTARLQIYDDVLLKWTDLVTCTQLHEYDQLYAFQPQSPWHIDVQKDLPPPRPPTVHTGGGMGSASRGSIPPAANTPSSYQDYSHLSGGGGGASPAAMQPVAGSGRSPNQDRLEQQRMREEQLRQELARTHEETMRLEAASAAEREDEMRRQAEAEQRGLAQREAEIQRQRQQLAEAEADYHRALERRNVSGGGGGGTPSRPLY